MGAFSSLLILWCALCSFVCYAEDSFVVPVHRQHADPVTVNAASSLRKRHSGKNPVDLGKSLYWFGNFTVGDSKSLGLLIDSGSSDLLTDPGLYKPSKAEKPFKPAKKFTITYEGVNRQGFGFETINGTVKRDTVTAGGLTVPEQPFGIVKTFQYKDAPQNKKAIQGQGIIGFRGKDSSSFGARSWFSNLCKLNAISQCRFALAFGTSGTGTSVFGTLAKKLYKGDLTVVPRLPKTEPFGSAYTVKGDVALSGKIVFKNQTLIMDSGTNNIQGPITVVRQIFKMLGYQVVETNGGPNPFNPGTDLKILNGYFPCNKPPKLGFSLPSESDLQNSDNTDMSKKSKLFNVSPKVWDVFDHGNNNCTSILGGTNALTNLKEDFKAWLIGQSFFSGHYVDFNNIASTVGFADLKNPSTAE